MHLQGQQLGGMQLLKDGRIAQGMDINGAAADPRMSALQDMCNQGQLEGGMDTVLGMVAFSSLLVVRFT